MSAERGAALVLYQGSPFAISRLSFGNVAEGHHDDAPLGRPWAYGLGPSFFVQIVLDQRLSLSHMSGHSQSSLNEAIMKPRAYSKESLIAFLESKDPDEGYNYLSFFNCLHAQYLAFLGVPRICYTLLFPFLALWHHNVELLGAASPHTFGAALERVNQWSDPQ